jgi:hypothetical protein
MKGEKTFFKQNILAFSVQRKSRSISVLQKILDLPFHMILPYALLAISGSSSKQFVFILFGYEAIGGRLLWAEFES